MRAFRRDAVRALDLRTSGMEFASEMIAVAMRRGLEVSQVPTTLRVDGREGASHLRPLADGSRHVAVLMVHSTRRLPSRSLSALQLTLLTSILLLGARDVEIVSLRLSIGTLLVACLALTVAAALRVVDVAMRAADEAIPRIETSRDTRASAIRVRIARTAVALWPMTAASVGLVGSPWPSAVGFVSGLATSSPQKWCGRSPCRACSLPSPCLRRCHGYWWA
jgi:hypothetical protein